MKDFFELLKNVSNIFGILFAGIIILIIFPQEVASYRFYIVTFLSIILGIIIIKYSYNVDEFYNLFKGCSIIELLIIEKCCISEIQSLNVKNDDPIYIYIESLVIKGIFILPDRKKSKTNIFVMSPYAFGMLRSRILKKILKRTIKKKSKVNNEKLLKLLSKYLVDYPVNEILDYNDNVKKI